LFVPLPAAQATLLLTGRFVQLPIDDGSTPGQFLSSAQGGALQLGRHRRRQRRGLLVPGNSRLQLRDRRRREHLPGQRSGVVGVSHGDRGKASVLLRGKDPNLGFATPPPVPTVVVQLHAENGECWAATYSAPRVNDESKFNRPRTRARQYLLRAADSD